MIYLHLLTDVTGFQLLARAVRINAGNMRSKIPIFFASVAACDYDVVVITESWLIPSALDAEITPPGWLLFRRDRYSNIDATGYGGGVIILVRTELCPSLLLSSDSLELLWVKLALQDQTVLVGAAYIPPQSVSAVYDDLVEACRSVVGNLTDEDDALLFCDLNMPAIR